MKKLVLATMFALVIMSQAAFACISEPKVEANACGEFTIMMFSEESEVDAVLASQKDICELADQDIQVIKEFVMNGYSVIEQTDEQYAVFLEQANTANSGRPDDCLAYEAVAHRGRWTGYLETGYAYDSEYGCAVPLCTNIAYSAKWNDLGAAGIVRTVATTAVLIPAIIAIVAAIALFLFLKKP
ncbi:MAG: hypothetical protein ACE5J7_05390, partial [Candidatus Aenigmatarchaeota archaeon]